MTQDSYLPALIVDDSFFDRRRLQRMALNAAPQLPLLFASTLAEAQAHLARKAIGLILLDNVLPDGLGVDFLTEARKLSRGAMTIVLMTDHPTPFMEPKARDRQVDEIWLKSDLTYEVLQQKILNKYAAAR